MERTLRIRASLEGVRQACDFIVHAAEEAGLDPRAVYHCEMAVDEVCTNIVEHGFKDRADGEILLRAREADPCLEISIEDNSSAFDPTRRDDPDIQSDVKKLEPGGWGIYFVKKLMDTIQYEYSDGKNKLTLMKCMPESAETFELETDLIIQIAAMQKGWWTLTPQGRLDGQNAAILSDTLDKQVDHGRHHLILDLSDVDYVSSSGLKVLAAAWRSLRDHDGNLVLVGLNNRLYEIFDMVGFTTFFDVFPDVDKALEGA